MTKIYQNEEKKSLLEQNDALYCQFLGKQFNGLKDTSDEGYYQKLFETIIASSGKNEKVFSQLKHLCYELSGYFDKAGETVHKIVAVLENYVASETELYKKINFETSENVNITSKKLLTGLSEWGSQLLIQKKFIIDNMAGFFHYKKHENAEMAKLLSMQPDIQLRYKKKAQALESTKQKLFDSKMIDKWKIDYTTVQGDFNNIAKKYELVKEYMIPLVA